jgi:very-short-patch-repair endonuclease
METRKKISQAVIDFMVKNPERQGNMVLARQGRTSKPQLNMYQIIKMKVGEVEVILNHHVRTLNHYRFIDVAIPSLMLGFEYDGEYFHSDVSHDKQRDAELVAIGWTIAHIDSNGLKYMAGKQKHRGRKKSKAHR